MEPNRYQPPRSRIDPRNREPGSIPKAVAVGALIDIGGTILGSFIVGMCYAVLLGMQGLSSDAITKELSEADRWSAPGLITMAIGLLMSVLGGYQCAAIANRTTYLAPGILSIVSVALGAMMNDARTELPELLFFSAITVAAILGGASLHTRKLIEPPSTPAAKE
jgi:hypothetical protein